VKESSFTMIAMDGGICARITIRGLIFFKWCGHVACEDRQLKWSSSGVLLYKKYRLLDGPGASCRADLRSCRCSKPTIF
jgi:hypothetical protein